MRGLASKAGSNGTPDFTPARKPANLRLVSSADGHLLLDIEHDRILKLNSVGAEVWALLAAGDSESQIVHKISRRYQINEQTVANDVHALLEQLERLEISPSCSAPAERSPAKSKDIGQQSYPWYGESTALKPEPSRPAVIWAFIGLLFFDVILCVFRLKNLCSLVGACPIIQRNFDANTSGEICSAVEKATVWYPKQVVCFQRSAVTACLLRCYGIQARMMIGIRTLPLLAHSWVEVDGAVVNDWRPVSQFYHATTSY